MPPSSGLYLHEEVMLLALHETKGTVIHSFFTYAVGGAALAELLLANRVSTETVRKSKLVLPRLRTMIGEPFLDECLTRVTESKRPQAVQTWVSRFAGSRGLKQRLADRMYMRGILLKQEKPVLFLFSRVLYPTANARPRQQIIDRLRNAIDGDGAVDARTAILVGLTHHSGLLRRLLDKKQLKARKQRIKEITTTQAAVEGTAEAVAAVQAALIAVSAATAAASSS
jgi:hypothetical protein